MEIGEGRGLIRRRAKSDGREQKRATFCTLRADGIRGEETSEGGSMHTAVQVAVVAAVVAIVSAQQCPSTVLGYFSMVPGVQLITTPNVVSPLNTSHAYIVPCGSSPHDPRGYVTHACRRGWD